MDCISGGVSTRNAHKFLGRLVGRVLDEVYQPRDFPASLMESPHCSYSRTSNSIVRFVSVSFCLALSNSNLYTAQSRCTASRHSSPLLSSLPQLLPCLQSRNVQQPLVAPTLIRRTRSTRLRRSPARITTLALLLEVPPIHTHTTTTRVLIFQSPGPT